MYRSPAAVEQFRKSSEEDANAWNTGKDVHNYFSGFNRDYHLAGFIYLWHRVPGCAPVGDNASINWKGDPEKVFLF